MANANQIVFDRVLRALKKQGKPAQRCFYRCPDGTKCAIGLVITDKHIKGCIGYVDKHVHRAVERSIRRGSIDMELLTELQFAHDRATRDGYFTPTFKDEMFAIAKRWNLEVNEAMLQSM